MHTALASSILLLVIHTPHSSSMHLLLSSVIFLLYSYILLSSIFLLSIHLLSSILLFLQLKTFFCHPYKFFFICKTPRIHISFPSPIHLLSFLLLFLRLYIFFCRLHLFSFIYIPAPLLSFFPYTPAPLFLISSARAELQGASKARHLQNRAYQLQLHVGGCGGGPGRLHTHDEPLELRGPGGTHAVQRAGEGRVAACLLLLVFILVLNIMNTQIMLYHFSSNSTSLFIPRALACI